MMLFTLTAAVLASTSLPRQEVDLALNPETPGDMQHFLLDDAFTRLDLDGDGLLTKTERKPLISDAYEFVFSAKFTSDENPDAILKTAFVRGVFVPDYGYLQNPTEQECHEESMYVNLSGDEVWAHMFSADVDSVSVEEFVDRYYDLTEHDDALTRSQFEARMAQQQQAPPNSLLTRLSENGETLHVNQIDTYTESHNPQCSEVARRQLFFGVDEAVAFSFAAMEAVLVTFFYAALGAAVECAAQEVVHRARFGSAPWFLATDNGCTRQQYLEDLSWTFVLGGGGNMAWGLGARAFSFLGAPVATEVAAEAPTMFGRPMGPVASGSSVGSGPITLGGGQLAEVEIPGPATEAIAPVFNNDSSDDHNVVTCNFLWCGRRSLTDLVTAYLNFDSTPTEPSSEVMNHWTKLVEKI